MSADVLYCRIRLKYQRGSTSQRHSFLTLLSQIQRFIVTFTSYLSSKF